MLHAPQKQIITLNNGTVYKRSQQLVSYWCPICVLPKESENKFNGACLLGEKMYIYTFSIEGSRQVNGRKFYDMRKYIITSVLFPTVELSI